MADDTREKRRFGELQMAILRVLWDRKEATVREILDALAPRRTPAHSTVATVLSRLEEQGVVAHRREGRSHVYRARVREPDVRASMVEELVDRAFGGDPGELLTHLVRRSEIEGADLDALRRLIDDRDG